MADDTVSGVTVVIPRGGGYSVGGPSTASGGCCSIVSSRYGRVTSSASGTATCSGVVSGTVGGTAYYCLSMVIGC